MAGPLFANTAEFEVRMLLDNQKVENTLYFTSPTSWDAAELNVATQALGDAWADNMMPLLATGLSLREVYAKDLSVAESFEATWSAGSGISGSAGTQVSNNISLCVSFRTLVTGRSNRGRNYVAGIPATALATANTFSTAFAESIINAYNAVITAMNDNNWTHVIASRYHNGVERAVGATQPVASYIVTDLTVDSMRRRLPGRGA